MKLIKKKIGLLKNIWEIGICRSWLLYLDKKGYIIPANNKSKNNKSKMVYTQNVLINMVIFIADMICIIISLYGMEQQIITFFGVITYAIYTFAEQAKIVNEQYEYSKRTNGVFKWKNRKLNKKIPPNLVNCILVLFLLGGLLTLALFDLMTGETIEKGVYYCCIIGAYILLFILKVKYMIFDIFNIKKWSFVEELGKEVIT